MSMGTNWPFCAMKKALLNTYAHIVTVYRYSSRTNARRLFALFVFEKMQAKVLKDDKFCFPVAREEDYWEHKGADGVADVDMDTVEIKPVQRDKEAVHPADMPKVRVVAAVDFGSVHVGVKICCLRKPKESEYIVLDPKNPGKKTLSDVIVRRNSEGKLEVVCMGVSAVEFIKNSDSPTMHEGKPFYYFKEYKMALYAKDGVLDTRVKAVNADVRMDAAGLFGLVLRYAQAKVVAKVAESGMAVRAEEIRWVLTVPAIWSRESCMRMVDAARIGGLNQNLLNMVYEPEAGAIACNEYSVEKGETFVVVDCGGGTVDIVVMARGEDGTLRTIEHPDGGDWGSMYVNRRLMDLCEKISGERIDESKNPAKYMALWEKMETFKTETTLDVSEPFPVNASDLGFRRREQDIDERVRTVNMELPADEKIVVKKSVLLFPRTIVARLIREYASNIERILVDIFKKHDIKHAFRLGGFSQSEIVCQELDNILKRVGGDMKWHQPPNIDLAVLDGALEFGKNSDIISEHVSNVNIAVLCLIPWDPVADRGLEKYKVEIKGRSMLSVGLSRLVKRGDVLTPGKTVSKMFKLPCTGKATSSFYVYDGNTKIRSKKAPGVRKLCCDISYTPTEEQRRKNATINIHCGGIVYFYEMLIGSEKVAGGVLTSPNNIDSVENGIFGSQSVELIVPSDVPKKSCVFDSDSDSDSESDSDFQPPVKDKEETPKVADVPKKSYVSDSDSESNSDFQLPVKDKE